MTQDQPDSLDVGQTRRRQLTDVEVESLADELMAMASDAARRMREARGESGLAPNRHPDIDWRARMVASIRSTMTESES